MQTVIETKALCKQYGPHTAVDHVELHVPQGCVYGFIGPNGAPARCGAPFSRRDL